jgi:hypothetical protein
LRYTSHNKHTNEMAHKIEVPEFKMKPWHGVEMPEVPLLTVEDILEVGRQIMKD